MFVDALRVAADRDARRAVRRVLRLASQAERRPATGIRAALARRTWERLGRQADRWSEPERRRAVEAVLADWADAGTPDDERRELLARWSGGEGPFAGTVTGLATNPRNEHRNALAAFCVRHGLAPDDEADRVCFFALTGQFEQRRALDPDGSLLAAAYQAADPPTRAGLREALASDGDLDVVRVVAGGGQRSAEVEPEERAYLTAQLADRRDWAGLWRLARDLPVCDAVAALRPVDPRWRPEAQRDRELLRLLTGADPAAVRRARDELGEDCVIRIEIPGEAVAGALCDDSRRLAVWTYDGHRPAGGRWPRPTRGTISVYDLPDGALVTRHHADIWQYAGLAYCGGTLIATVSGWDESHPDGSMRLYRCPDGQPKALAFSDDRHAVAVAASRRGFVSLDSSSVLTFHEADGRPVTTVRPGPQPGALFYNDKDSPVAVDYETGRTAVLTSNSVTVLDQHSGGAQVIARLSQPLFTKNICFRRGDHVVVAGDRQAVQWRLASQPTDNFGAYDYRGDVCADVPKARHLIWVPRQDTICHRDGSGRIGYLDGQSLWPISVRRQLAGRTGTVLFGSTRGTYHALAGNGFADVVMDGYMPLWDLADRPQAAWTPADLSAFTGTGWLPARSPGVRPFYELMRACAEHRFGGDVGIGRDTPRAGDDEIGISTEESDP